mgnify:CR=1 FL=1
MTRFTRLLAASLFVVSGLFGCGNPLPAEETINAEGAIAPTTAPMSVAAPSEAAASSSEPDAAGGTGGESIRCGLVRKGSCSDGWICNVRCCDLTEQKSYWETCGTCQHFGNAWCAGRGGLRDAWWSNN